MKRRPVRTSPSRALRETLPGEADLDGVSADALKTTQPSDPSRRALALAGVSIAVTIPFGVAASPGLNLPDSVDGASQVRTRWILRRDDR
jgi:hypothetical protein